MNKIPSWSKIEILLQLNFRIEFYKAKEPNAYGDFRVGQISISNFLSQLVVANTDYKTEIRRIKESSNIEHFKNDLSKIKTFLIQFKEKAKSLEDMKNDHLFQSDPIHGYYPLINYEIVINYGKYLKIINDIISHTNDAYYFITNLNVPKLSFNISVHKNLTNRTKLNKIYDGLKKGGYLKITKDVFIKEMSSKNSNQSLNWEKKSNASLKYFLVKLKQEFNEVPKQKYLEIAEAIFMVDGKTLRKDTLTNTKGRPKVHMDKIDSIFLSLPK